MKVLIEIGCPYVVIIGVSVYSIVRIYKSISIGDFDSGSDSILGAGIENGLAPTRPKKRQRFFEPNRSASSPMSAPSRSARIGRAGASWHVGLRGRGRLCSERTQRFVLETTQEGWSSMLMVSCAETETATRAATGHEASTRRRG
jgi:hypothetical protein